MVLQQLLQVITRQVLSCPDPNVTQKSQSFDRGCFANIKATLQETLQH